MVKDRFIVMLGTDLRSPGGITAVVQAYVDGGLMQQWPLRYLATYHVAGVRNKLGTAAAALWRFCGWVLMGRVAAVHAHVAARGSFWRKSLFLLIGGFAGARTVFHLHDGSFPSWYAGRSVGAQWLVRWVLRRMDRVVVLTDGWRVPIAAIEPTARLAVLRNPVVLPQQSASPLPGVVLFLGRLWPEKGIYDLLAAAATLQDRCPDLHLVCGGDGDLEQVRLQVQEQGLAGRVSLPGWVDGAEKARLFASASVFVLPSYFEGLPMAVLEAMAWGVPVIASRVGGVPEALGDDAGLMFPAGDVQALAAQLYRVLADPVLRSKMGAAGQRRVADLFQRDQVLADVGAIYAQLGLKPLNRAAAATAKER